MEGVHHPHPALMTSNGSSFWSSSPFLRSSFKSFSFRPRTSNTMNIIAIQTPARNCQTFVTESAEDHRDSHFMLFTISWKWESFADDRLLLHLLQLFHYVSDCTCRFSAISSPLNRLTICWVFPPFDDKLITRALRGCSSVLESQQDESDYPIRSSKGGKSQSAARIGHCQVTARTYAGGDFPPPYCTREESSHGRT